MFTVRLLTVSPTRRDFVREGLGFYIERLNHFCNFHLVEVREVPLREGEKGGMEWARRRAAVALVAKRAEGFASIQVDQRGRQLTSEEFAGWLDGVRGTKPGLDVILGGAVGLDPMRVDLSLSLGPWTLPHELARLVVVEGLYRAFTILTGHPYHK
ncbi:MAG: 23S rRNA (pseudouridine(1915)-N(3))-methyltransferase RlmH [bacterium]|nr:23S rRNA (pseudouridine(1915)-N(3))-methyltransferase RlmH [bacterium]